MSDLTVTKTSKRNVTEIPPPQKAVTTQHVQETCSCNVCGLGGIEPEAAPPDVDADGSEDVSESPQKTGPEAALPKRGNYGMNVILKIAENFLQRMPHRMSAKSLQRHLTRMSHGTVSNPRCASKRLSRHHLTPMCYGRLRPQMSCVGNASGPVQLQVGRPVF